MPSRFSRRAFLKASAAAAAAAWLGPLERAKIRAAAGPRPAFGRTAEEIDTRWPIKRVIYLMVENRSFDNLFGRFPGANGTTVGVREGKEVPLIHCPDWLPGDLPHDLIAHIKGHAEGNLDGFAQGKFGPRYAYSQFARPDIPNYWYWAENYVLSDNLFASAPGPSHPVHLYWIAGQAGGVIDNPEFTGIIEYPDGRQFKSWGCDAVGENVFVFVRDEHGNVTKHSTCLDLPTVGEQLSERDIDWVHYAPEKFQTGYFWNAYTAIRNVFYSELFRKHVSPVDDLLRDVEAGALPAVTWIAPRWQLSDHPPASTCHCHNWVTDIVNGIMRSPMWEHTAIFITWDEWGGFYDHVLPPKVNGLDLGFRVPMLVISPYAKRGYLDDALGDFTSPLRFIADNWDLPYLTDRIGAVHNFEHVFDFDRPPRPPDPRPRHPGCHGDPFQFPDEFPEWPDDIEPDPPNLGEEGWLPEDRA